MLSLKFGAGGSAAAFSHRLRSSQLRSNQQHQGARKTLDLVSHILVRCNISGAYFFSWTGCCRGCCVLSPRQQQEDQKNGINHVGKGFRCPPSRTPRTTKGGSPSDDSVLLSCLPGRTAQYLANAGGLLSGSASGLRRRPKGPGHHGFWGGKCPRQPQAGLRSLGGTHPPARWHPAIVLKAILFYDEEETEEESTILGGSKPKQNNTNQPQR